MRRVLFILLFALANVLEAGCPCAVGFVSGRDGEKLMCTEMVNVRDFGAAGNGVTLDTAAIQKALDTGKKVLFPAGVYLSGTVYLRTGSGIHLEEGAVILGSSDKEQYNAPDFAPQNWWSVKEKASGAHLIVALNVKDISITGKGVIDGNARAMFERRVTGKDQHYYERPEWRPSQMIWICDSRNIEITDVTLKDAPYWNCFLYGCENAVISGVTIRADRAVRNSDGVDIDSCKDVTIRDCDIYTGDDSIAIRADGESGNRPYGGGVLSRENICENIKVYNCRLSSTTCAVRIGVGSGVIRNCEFSDLDIYETRTGISLCASFNGVKFCEIKDITVRNVKFSGLAAFWFFNDWTGKFANRNGKKCSNILVENFTGIQTNGSMIIGNADYGMRDLVFKNVHIKQTENRQKSDINADPDIFRRAWDVPCVIYFRNVNGLELKESTFTGVPELKDVCINVLNRI